MEIPSENEESFNYRDGDIQYSGDGEDFQAGGTAKMVQNQPHDEEVALSDTADSFTGRDEPPKVTDASLIESLDDDGPAMPTATSTFANQYGQEAKPGKLTGMDRSAELPGGGAGLDGDKRVYNAMDFRHLNVSADVSSVFELIGKYKPHDIELDTKLKPFIPDYIPSIGGIDEFIKVPRPDGKEDFLGLKVLDEPAARQSDPTVLTLQLRQLTKEAPGNQASMVGRIEHSDEQKRKKIEGWVSSVNAIHKDKPPASVAYKHKMPDIEALMQEWPPEMEAFIKTMKMPTGDLDLDLKTMTTMICGLLDIPVYENPVESLHLLFSLYLEFKHNPIFGQQAADIDQARMNFSRGTGRSVGTVDGGMGGGGANVMTF